MATLRLDVERMRQLRDEVCTAVDVDAASPLLAGQVAELTEFGGDTERILVVGDDSRTARLIDLALSSEGLAVSCVSSVGEALVRAQDWKPDVVVINMVLPDGAGPDL